ncbi:ornithine cyclodeaminase family protein [Salirhabdus salicampi]|uniref:ornithine cyclodeaminase family protein n=1 Tax=Salirhabdus salicampi TaxID=476102 RepID=UPI0020C48733|nr:ornithine cyclodeaminase family protein [Salirhabdus salicampi]MCP8615932.1 ornithine cyclodeaminase family protein [Salirhabdus salicampi]
MLVISKEEQKQLVNMNEVIDNASLALKEFSANRTVTPIRAALPFHNGQNTSLVMPSVAEELKSVGLKVVSVAPNNTKIGKKAINGVVMLSDFESGEPVAMLEGSYLTMVRTGALSGVATKYLAREDAKTLSVIGTGAQAEGLVAAVLAVRNIEQIYLYNRTKKKAEEFARYVFDTYGIQTEVISDANETVKKADIVVTATNALTPVFSDSLQPGVHVNAVGSFRPTMQELPSNAVTSANKVVVEAKDAALEETGDLQVPIREGLFNESDIYSELGKVVAGDYPGRESEREITLFKSVGLAVVDIVVARYIYDKAKVRNIGTKLHL